MRITRQPLHERVGPNADERKEKQATITDCTTGKLNLRLLPN